MAAETISCRLDSRKGVLQIFGAEILRRVEGNYCVLIIVYIKILIMAALKIDQLGNRPITQ